MRHPNVIAIFSCGFACGFAVGAFLGVPFAPRPIIGSAYEAQPCFPAAVQVPKGYIEKPCERHGQTGLHETPDGLWCLRIDMETVVRDGDFLSKEVRGIIIPPDDDR